MRAKHQRLWLGIAALVAVIGAAVLALSALQDQAAFFYAPSDVQKNVPPLDRGVRLGGMVVVGSIERAADGVSIAFDVTDGGATVPVRFAGITPDLFREGSGVVAEGRFQQDGSFVADNILAKHDERYMPPEIAGAMHKSESLEQ